MLIVLSPQFRDDAIALTRAGDVLIVNGARFDFGSLPEGHTLPLGAVVCDWIVGDVVRRDGQLTITVLFPHTMDASEAARFPAPVIDPPDGPIALPDAGWTTRTPVFDEDGNPIEGQFIEHRIEPVMSNGVGAIDWSQAVAPEPLPPIVISAELLFFDRMTDDEYDDLDASVRSGETARVYRGWAAAAVFEERTAMWDLLVKHLDAIGTTPARRAELLARPASSSAMADEIPAGA